MKTSHETFMKEAILEAEKGVGFVSPNPAVGAVIVRSGSIIARGYHAEYGGPHAEVNALEKAGTAARGAAMYVTLEPCAREGKTPACTDVIRAAGIRRVYFGMNDPNPVMAGGAEVLNQAGIKATGPILENRCRQLNQPFIKMHQHGKPYITAKWAMTLDGKIAARSADSQWISSAGSRKEVHVLRAHHDAVAVGKNTVLADNPMLTARNVGKVRQPVRIVFDSGCTVSPTANLIRTATTTPVMVLTTTQAPQQATARLAEAGCEVLICRSSKGQVSIPDALNRLARRGISSVLVEGGSRLLGTFFDNKQVDCSQVYISPDIIGGKNALPPVGGLGKARMIHRLTPLHWKTEYRNKNIVVESVYREY